MSKVAFVFPGQGSQYIGMSKVLWNDFSVVKRVFEEADDTLGFKLSELCFEGESNLLHQTINAQPALLTAGFAAYCAAKEVLEIEPHLMAGHSLGEYSALVCSGYLTFQDGLHIVRKRGALMHQVMAHGTGKMVAISNVRASVLESLCQDISVNGHVTIACYNSDSQHVVSGDMNSLEILVEKVKHLYNSKVHYLTVSGPFHSVLMQPAAEQFAHELSKFHFGKGNCPVISNVTAQPHQYSQIYDLLYRQIIHPVRWNETMTYLQQNGIGTVLELGPRQVLGQLMKEKYPGISTYSIHSRDSLQAVRQASVEQRPTPADVVECWEEGLAAALIARNRNSDVTQHLTGVIYPSQQIRDWISTFQDQKNDLDADSIGNKILDLLRTILHTKQVPAEEQKRILNLL